ncbi:MAG: hypothetical protein KUG73_01580, partial [Pseudomonadales bacterium]|nr:hypothetical protein [Pseudomonadales bacterium]
ISIALAAILGVFSSSMSRSADPMWRNKAIKLAQLYLDEVLSKKYDENTPVGGVPAAGSGGVGVPALTACVSLGPEAGETRSTYDDVDDYDGLTDSPPVAVNGALDGSYGNYAVSVVVICDGTAVSVNGNQHAKKIKVTVTPPAQGAMDFYTYKGNY